jgi:NAD(P)-dependent dehydrogenase (short-subunit alcohol dehydrogenase family)
MPRLQGKTILITGATSGIGKVAAESLAAQGARIIFVARDRERGEQLLEQMRGIGPAQAHFAHYADLSQLAQMKRVVALLAAGETHLDVLINNAGAIYTTRELTEDGLERTFATNHLAYFVLTNLLLPQLQAAPSARIICTASNAHRSAKLDFADLQSAHAFNGLKVYGRSKLMNILFTRELARRLQGSGITANSLHPGFVATRFGDSGSGLLALALKGAKLFALTPHQGAQTLIYLASSPEVATVTGEYFHKCKPATPSRQAQNDTDAKRLWEVSAQLSGVGV